MPAIIRIATPALHLEYVYKREDGGLTTLTYELENDNVVRIRMELTGVKIP